MVRDQLSGNAYHDQDIFEKEQKTIFERTWLYAGHSNQIPEVGDVLSVKAGNENVFVVRTDVGIFKAYINMCPHRGARLINTNKNCKKGIICPYHAWTFNLQGELVGIPAQKHYLPETNLDDFKLHQVQCEVWRGLIFINISNKAEPLLSHLSEFATYLNGYAEPIEEMELQTTVVMEEPINWKIIIENYVEDYHFSFVHPETLKVFNHKETHTLPTGDHIRVFMPYETKKPIGVCKYPWTGEGGSQQGFVWPSMTIQPAINHLSVFQIIPISEGKTQIRIPLFQTPSQKKLWPMDLQKMRNDVLFDMEEDFVICRELQKNTRSQYYKIGVHSTPHELGVFHFARTWLKYMS